MMRLRPLLSLAVLASLVAAPAAADAAPTTKLKVRSCQVGDGLRDREATFYSRMRAVPGTARMRMRFTLLDRTASRSVPVKVPELAKWRRSRPGVKTFGYAQTVSGLQAGGIYAVTVHYRWIRADGTRIKAQRRTSSDCRQSGSTANLSVTRVTSDAGQAEGTENYAIEVVNRGTAKAAEFDVDLIVDSAAADSERVHELNPGEATTIKLTGPACLARVRAVADPAGAVTETNEDDNTLRSRCPGGA